MKEEQKSIYFACGETNDKIDMLPQADAVKEKGYEILYCTDDVDEFALQMLREYDGKSFMNICADKLDLDTDEEKEDLKKENEDTKELRDFMKETLGDSVSEVVFTNKLKNYPVCLTSEGMLSLEMEKVLASMPNSNGMKAKIALEINRDHPIAAKLKSLFETDKETVKKYTKILYAQGCLIGGKTIENPAEFSELVSELM